MKNHNFEHLGAEVPQHILPHYATTMEGLWYGGEALRKTSEILHAATQREHAARLATIALAAETEGPIDMGSLEYRELRSAQAGLTEASKLYYEAIHARMKLTEPAGEALAPVYRAVDEERQRREQERLAS